VSAPRTPREGATLDAPEFADWVRPHLSVLSALAVRSVGTADAEDLVQDALVRAWRRRSTYRTELGSERAWLIGVLYDQARRRRVRARPGSTSERDERQPAPEERLDVEAAIRTLPRRQREVVTLYYLADLSVEDVARVLSISTGSVKSHLSDARTRLREVLT